MGTQIATLEIALHNVAMKIHDMLEGAKDELGLRDVWFGDTRLTPRYPCALVIPNAKSRALRGTHRYDVMFSIQILLYHAKIESREELQYENEVTAQSIANFLDTNPSLDGMVIHGYVERLQPGTAPRGTVMVTATRLTWSGVSREEM